jgi:hypothetical protein
MGTHLADYACANLFRPAACRGGRGRRLPSGRWLQVIVSPEPAIARDGGCYWRAVDGGTSLQLLNIA